MTTARSKTFEEITSETDRILAEMAAVETSWAKQDAKSIPPAPTRRWLLPFMTGLTVGAVAVAIAWRLS